MCNVVLISEIILYKFELSHNAAKATKNICCVKNEGAVIHSTVAELLKKFCFVYNNLNNQAISSYPKIMDFEAMPQDI